MEKNTYSTVLTDVVAEQMKNIIKKKGYMSESEFIRQAIVEKIQREG